jgi:hypothetical protein
VRHFSQIKLNMTLHYIFNRDDKQIEITIGAYMGHETKMDDDITSLASERKKGKKILTTVKFRQRQVL